MKEEDSSEKQVYHCELCDKWFCERHLKPKFPYFVDWDTVFDVQGNPEIKALFHTEYKREGGHPDFVYWRRKFEALDIEEKTRNELIRQAMDRMMHPEKYGIEVPVDAEADRKKRVEILRKEEKYPITARVRAFSAFEPQTEKNMNKNIYAKSGDSTRTYENIHNYHFEVPTKVYSDEEYRERLNNARTQEEVEQIINDYNRHQRKEPEQEKPEKKKHWWQ